MRHLNDKVAVITGAGSGIGRSTALALAREGTHIAVCEVDGISAECIAAEISSLGRRVSVHVIDVSAEADMATLPEEVLAAHGRVDILVNNAGIAQSPIRFTDCSRERFEHVMNVNLWGIVNGCAAFLPHLRDRSAANIVNVVSYAGLMAVPGMSPYVTSKFAARGFTETLRMELHDSPIRVTMVCPGTTRTSLMANAPGLTDAQRRALQRSLDSPLATRPERVAARIITAIRRDRPRVLVGGDTVIVDVLARALPGLHWRAVAWGFDRFLEKRLRTAVSSGLPGSVRRGEGAS